MRIVLLQLTLWAQPVKITIQIFLEVSAGLTPVGHYP
jgi:hypothetical protein